MTPRRVLVACGTRPEFVKLAPVVAEMRSSGFEVRTVATGQHYDQAMSDSFFDELGLVPDERFDLEGDDAKRLGGLVEQAERELAQGRPELVVVLGDTNTVPAYGLAARRQRVPVVHLEAGLRSFNETSMEEVNRKVAAAVARLQLAPTGLAERFLRAEGVPAERVRVVGNPVIDVLRRLGATPRRREERTHILVTAHRATNVDNPSRLERLVSLVERLAAELGPVVFPLHPRTRARLREASLEARLGAGRIELSDPVSYTTMLELLATSCLVVTDSGGLQEEASYFGVPVLVLRTSTPRWEGVCLGTARLVGLDVEAAIRAAERFVEPAELARVASVACPYGDGHTAERVTALLADDDVFRMLSIEEPAIGWLPPGLQSPPG